LPHTLEAALCWLGWSLCVQEKKLSFFLKIEAWQLFLLVVGIPFGLNYFLMSALVSSSQPSPEMLFKIMPIFMLFFMAIYLFWFWSLGLGINSRISDEYRPKVKFFKFGIIYSAAYMVLFHIMFVVFTSGGTAGGAMAIIFPLHIFAMYCMFYALFFIAKNLVTYEQKQTVKFYSFFGPFFLLWFFPIGIWFIQPRINKIYAENNT